jgi:transposase-like protein
VTATSQSTEHCPPTLRRWVRQAECDAGQRQGLTTDERQRLKELEREVHELKRANEILLQVRPENADDSPQGSRDLSAGSPTAAGPVNRASTRTDRANRATATQSEIGGNVT